MKEKILEKKLRYLFLLGMCFSIFFLAFFRHEVFSFALRSYLNIQMPVEGGWQFHYDHAGRARNKIGFSGIDLWNRDRSVELHIHHLDLNFSGLRKGTLKPKILISHPELNIEKNGGSSGFDVSFSKIAHSPLAKWMIDIEEGKIFLKEDGCDPIPIFLSLTSDAKRRSVGSFMLSHQEDLLTHPDLGLKLYTWPREVIMELELQDGNLPWMAKVLRFFNVSNRLLNEVEQGEVNGRLWMGLYPDGVISQLTGALRASEFIATNEEKDIETSFYDVHVDVSYPSGKRLKTADDRFSWQNCVLKSQVKGGVIHYKDPKESNEYALCDLSGTVNFNSFKHSEIYVKGYLDQKGNRAPILLSGNPSLLDPETLDLDLKLFLNDAQESTTHLGVSITSLEEHRYAVKASLQELSTQQLGVIQHVVGLGFEPVNDFEIAEGGLSLECGAVLENGKVQELFLESLACHEFQLYWRSRDILAFCSECILKADLDLSRADPLSFPDINVEVENGDIIFGRKETSSLSISDLSLSIDLKNGVFYPSKMKGNVFGCQTEVKLSGPYENTEADVTFEVEADWLIDRFASKEKAFHTKSSLKQLLTSFHLQKRKGYWDITGHLDLFHESFLEEGCNFGFLINDDFLKYRDPLGFYQNAISSGWFQTKDISSDSVNFFLDLMEKELGMDGHFALEGTFDAEGVYLKTNIQHLEIASRDYLFTIGLNIEDEKRQFLEGQFFYHVATNDWKGSLPLEHATIDVFENHLQLRDLSTNLYFENQIVDFDQLKFESDGLQFQGKGRVSFSGGDIDSYVLKASKISGSALQLENFIHHFPTLKEWKLPFDGRVEVLREGVLFSSKKIEDHWEYYWDIACRLSHGSLQVKGLPLIKNYQIEDFRFDFHYSNETNQIQLTDIRGRLPSEGRNPYFLSGRDVVFDVGKEAAELSCDLRLENATMDIVRLVATSKFREKDQSWHIIFDREKSHIFSEPFSCKKCWYHPDKGLSSCNLSTEFSLENLHSLLKLVADLGWGFEGMQRLASLPLDGKLQAHLTRSLKGTKLSLTGRDLNVNGMALDELSVGLEKKGKVWSLHRFTLGDMFMQAKFQDSNGGFDISDFALLCKDTRMFVEKGHFSTKQRRLFCPLETMVIDCEQLGRVLKLSQQFSGICSVSGEVAVDFFKGGELFELSGKLCAESDNLFNQQFFLKTQEPLEFSYQMSQGLHMSQGELIVSGVKQPDFYLSLGCKDTTISNGQVGEAKGLYLQFTNDVVRYLAPLFLGPEGAQKVIENFPYAWSGFNQFMFNVAYDGIDYQLEARSNEDYYQIHDRARHLKELSFAIDRRGMNIASRLTMFDRDLQVQAYVLASKPHLTEIKVYELDAKAPLPHEALHATLSLQTPQGLIIHSLDGDLCGLDFAFLPKPKMVDAHVLTFLGSVKCDGEKLMPHVQGEFKDFLQELKLQKGYELSGEFTLSKDRPEEWFFEGFLKGKNFQFMGHEFTTMLGNIRIEPNGTTIENLRVSDESVNVSIPKIVTTDVPEKGTMMQIPELTIQEMRPSLMRRSRQSQVRLKPFCISTMTFQDVSGFLNDLSTFTGKGSLTFENTFKRDHHLLDIPIELISRLGLDMVLLVPIHGEMDYVLKKGKMVFTKLRNSYSEGKRSHFYLSNSRESYVDFDGNIAMQIKMKQYVLFKITELFVLTVNGTLDNPSFGLK